MFEKWLTSLNNFEKKDFFNYYLREVWLEIKKVSRQMSRNLWEVWENLDLFKIKNAERTFKLTERLF